MTKPLPHYPRLRWWLMAALISFVGLAFVEGAFAEDKPKLADVLDQDQSEQAPSQGPKESDAEGKFEPGVPRSSVRGFFAAAHDGDYERAAEYLDLRHLPRDMNPEMGPEYARQLKIVLDRSLWIDLDQLSTSPKGQAEDGLPTYRDRVGRVKLGRQDVDILLQRVPRSEGGYI